MSMAGNVFDLLDMMAFENPRPEERWFREGDFDPPYSRSALKAAERTGRVEINKGGDEWQWRFTAKGRDDYERELKEPPR